jgi:glutamate-5-semialdehyde dehydrogenase
VTKQVLETLTPGMQLVSNGNSVYTVTESFANQFKSGDKVYCIDGESEPIIIPKEDIDALDKMMRNAQNGFESLATLDASVIDAFYGYVLAYLSDDNRWQTIQSINNHDVENAQKKGRSTTRLVADDRCRKNMIECVRSIQQQAVSINDVVQQRRHDGWVATVQASPLGIVGFVFEGRPNVIVDATGLLKSGNAVVFRVGSDALQTAVAIMNTVIYPALDAAGISRHAIQLIDSSQRSAGWALFSHSDIGLAVARGSGKAVRMLSSIARQSGIPVSVHGTGGAWMVTSAFTDGRRLHDAIVCSLDRKVCNTLNTLCVLESEMSRQLPIIQAALAEAGDHLGASFKVHVESSTRRFLSPEMRESYVTVHRAAGVCDEYQYDTIDRSELGREWEWEKTPEISLIAVASIDEAVALFNRYSPQFIASLISDSASEQSSFFKAVNAPFVGNGMTRWVDGHYIFHTPELGLSNWENGRLLARSGVLSGDTVVTQRIYMEQALSRLKR